MMHHSSVYFGRFLITISLIIFLFYTFCISYNELNVNHDVALFRWALTLTGMYLLFIRFWNTISHIKV